jgi:hypothetical protein
MTRLMERTRARKVYPPRFCKCITKDLVIVATWTDRECPRLPVPVFLDYADVSPTVLFFPWRPHLYAGSDYRLSFAKPFSSDVWCTMNVDGDGTVFKLRFCSLCECYPS